MMLGCTHGTVTLEGDWTQAQITLFNAITHSIRCSIPSVDEVTLCADFDEWGCIDMALAELSDDLETEAENSSVFAYIWCKLKREMEEHHLHFSIDYDETTEESHTKGKVTFGVRFNALQRVDESYQNCNN